MIVGEGRSAVDFGVESGQCLQCIAVYGMGLHALVGRERKGFQLLSGEGDMMARPLVRDSYLQNSKF